MWHVVLSLHFNRYVPAVDAAFVILCGDCDLTDAIGQWADKMSYLIAIPKDCSFAVNHDAGSRLNSPLDLHNVPMLDDSFDR
jgi:hypothetical protein